MLTKTVDVHEAQTNLTKLLSSLTADAEIVLTEDNKPIARLVPVTLPSKQRVSGLHAGTVWMSSDFNNPLTELG
jgi:antitoxin (DNA-binding transcriptional repressor) of toxin-antitoxin stability system